MDGLVPVRSGVFTTVCHEDVNPVIVDCLSEKPARCESPTNNTDGQGEGHGNPRSNVVKSIADKTIVSSVTRLYI